MNSPAVVGRLERVVRPRVWACVWPDSHGGGGFTTMDERAARNYMDGAVAAHAAGNSTAVPVLVECWDQEGMAALARNEVAQMIEDCVPGGSLCDPQQVADALREWARVRYGPNV
jgi:hypothetical protein